MKKYLLSLCCLIAFTCLGQQAPIKVGDILAYARYPLVTVKGTPFSPAKITVLDFWATWCGPCIAAFPHLQALQEKYANRLQVLAVSDESSEKVADFLKKRAFALSFLVDTGKSLFQRFGVTERPLTALLSAEGELVWVGNSDQLDTILPAYLTRKSLPAVVPNAISAKYYTPLPAVTEANNTLYEFRLSVSSKTDQYYARTQKDKDQPVNIKYVAVPVSEVVQDLLSVPATRLRNERKDLDTVLVNLIARSHSPALIYGMVSGEIINHLQALFQTTITKEVKNAPVLCLKVTDAEKLNAVREDSEGGGFIKMENNQLLMTRISLEQLAAYGEAKTGKLIVLENTFPGKFNLALEKFTTMENFKQQLWERYSIVMQDTTADIEFVHIQ